MIGDSSDGLKFWQNKLGKKKVDAAVASQSGNRPSQQYVIEISRQEMRLLLDEDDDDDIEGGGDQHDSDDLED